MIHDKSVLALIPARGGSKGLPGKNIRLMAGKPLIAWSIEQAKQSKYIDRVVVSTDSKEIAEISLKYGADVPFLRPSNLATDEANRADTIMHCINFLENKGNYFDFLVFLEPTSPLRETVDIDKAIEILISNKIAESIVGVSKVESTHPSFLLSLENNFIRPYINNNYDVIRRQDLKTLYFFEGSLYIAKMKSFKKRKEFYHEKCLGYEVPKWKAFEVDDLVDFMVIEHLVNNKEILKKMGSSEKSVKV